MAKTLGQDEKDRLGQEEIERQRAAEHAASQVPEPWLDTLDRDELLEVARDRNLGIAGHVTPLEIRQILRARPDLAPKADELGELKKAELLDLAGQRGVGVPASATKQEILDALADGNTLPSEPVPVVAPADEPASTIGPADGPADQPDKEQ